KALEESMKITYALPRGPLPPVVIRELALGKYQPLLEVPGKGKAKVTEEQVAHDILSLQKHKKTSPADQYIFQRHISETTGSSRHDESPYALLGQSDSEEESKKAMLDQTLMKPLKARLDQTLVMLELSFGDLFFSDRPSDADKNTETKVESMVNVPIQQAMSSISLMRSPIIDLTSRLESPKEHQQFRATITDTTTTTTTTTLPPPQAQQQSIAEAMMIQRIGELEHIMANLI
nr:hypothetical protein [Tanacetum cinerariifolium]